LLARHIGPDVIFEPKKIKSVATLEKVLTKNPVWTELQPIIKQAEGKPSVAQEEDPRPMWTPITAGEFDSFDGGDLA
jgi:hypothetical protein